MFRYLLIFVLTGVTVFLARKRGEISAAKPFLVVLPVFILLLLVVRCSPVDRSTREIVSSLSLDFDAQGYMLGREVAALLPKGGAVLVLHPPSDFDARFRRLIDSQINGLRDSLPTPAYQLYIENLQANNPMGTVSVAELTEAVRRQPDIRAVVLLSSISLSPGDTYTGGDIPPIFLAETPASDEVDALLQQKVVRAVILPRTGAVQTDLDSKGLSRQERFEQRHIMRVNP